MARRLIGLDVGTNAVTVAEVASGATPRLDRFGQVALPRDAMREGEVVDDAAVTEAVARLRQEVELRKAAVRVGIATPRLIVRQVEMPVMTRDELASALQFQAGDLIPIPLDEAVLDFAILGTEAGEDGEPAMRVLLAAAQKATVMRLVAAVEAAGLTVGAVDLVPLALIRALGRSVAEDGPAAEGIVSFGGGVTAVAVHEGGVPRFVRVLGTAGRELTDAIASELDIPADTAEALKRQLGAGGDDLVARARTAIDRPLSILLDEVRSSLDYYRNQPGAVRLSRVVVTGGASQLPGLADRLGALVGVPVELARPRDTLAVGDIRFGEDELPRLDPYLPAAVGLALGGAGFGTVVDLLPRTRRVRRTTRTTAVAGGVAAAAALLALLAVPTVLASQNLADKKDERDEQLATNAEILQEINEKTEAQTQQQQLATLRAEVEGLLANDVSWARMLQEIGMTIPSDVWLTSFSGDASATGVPAADPTATTTTATIGTTAATAPGDTTDTTATTVPGGPGTGSTIGGTVQFEAMGVDYPSVAAWLTSLGDKITSINGLWVSNAAASDFNGESVVGFSSTASLTPDARSSRLEEFQEGGE